jgi:hypothetical protein
MREDTGRKLMIASALEAVAQRLKIGGGEGATTFERPTKAGDVITVNFNLDCGEEDAANAA